MKRYFLITLLVLVVSFGVGAGLALLKNPHLLDNLGSDAVEAPVDVLPEFALEDTAGTQRHSGEWTGTILVLNFWATWCPPCRAEMPAFAELQAKYQDHNVQFVGIAIDEKEAVTRFADELGITFPLLLGDMTTIGFSKRLGNRFGGLPYTVIVDRQGNIRHRQAAEIHKDDLDRLIQSLL